MDQVDVVAVVGSCAPERQRYAKWLSGTTERMFVGVHKLAAAPDPVIEAASVVQWANTPAGAVVEFPAHTMMTEMIGMLAHRGSATRLVDVVCVADAVHLLDDLRRDSYAARPALPWGKDTGVQYLAHAMLIATQLEFASVIVLVNWEALSTADLSTVMALVSHLGPRARLRLDRNHFERWTTGSPYSIGQERPGWVGLLNGEFDPHITDPRVSAFRYENFRPFHPERLKQLLDQRIEPGEFGTVIRSAGFCRIATRAGVVGQWDHIGRMISIEPLRRDAVLTEDEELLALGQELALIGLDLDREALTRALDQATISDAELAEGPHAWREYPDPFPAWPTVVDRAEE